MEETLFQRLRRRVLLEDGGPGDPWKDHWNLTPGDSKMHAEAAAELERLQRRVEELERDAQAKQARIDALMLEFCPDEMTPEEQMAEWSEHQSVVRLTADERAAIAAIDAALSSEPKTMSDDPWTAPLPKSLLQRRANLAAENAKLLEENAELRATLEIPTRFAATLMRLIRAAHEADPAIAQAYGALLADKMDAEEGPGRGRHVRSLLRDLESGELRFTAARAPASPSTDP